MQKDCRKAEKKILQEGEDPDHPVCGRRERGREYLCSRKEQTEAERIPRGEAG